MVGANGPLSAQLALLAIVGAVGLSPAAAAPRFDAAETLPDGTSLIPDSEERQLYYYVPQDIGLAVQGGHPQFSFVNVTGGDSGSPPAGVVSFTLRLSEPTPAQLLSWRTSIGATAKIRVLPFESATYQLALGRIGEESEGERLLASIGGRWTERVVNVRLDAASATLLWRALGEAGNSALTIVVDLLSRGMQPAANSSTVALEQAERHFPFSVPLRISRAEFPQLFRLLDRDEQITFRYRSLTVTCCVEFADESQPDLDQVLIEVAVKNKRGQRRLASIWFDRASQPFQELEFGVPELRESSYEYRVTRFLNSGQREVGEWILSTSAVLDASRYEIEAQLPGPTTPKGG